MQVKVLFKLGDLTLLPTEKEKEPENYFRGNETKIKI